MRITIIGCGYVGLVTAACFTEMGNTVVCVDSNAERLDSLRRGEMPIYEPGLSGLVASARQEKLLDFSNDISKAIDGADYIFNAVGTPPLNDGSVDLTAVYAVAGAIGDALSNYCVVVNKSTVPVGTAEEVERIIQSRLDARGVSHEFDVVSNPEFLKEGTAIADFMGPDRVIIGSRSDRARRRMSMLYAPYLKKTDRIMHMGTREAELTKYAANAMLATRVSFMNDMAKLCDVLSVDVDAVRQGVGADRRIGPAFLYPGCGYGGSCFPKDVQALMWTASEAGHEMKLLAEVEEINKRQKNILHQKLVDYYSGDISGKVVAVWGLAFKPGTDDMREAPSIPLIKSLVKDGARVKAFDPKSEGVAREIFESEIKSGSLVLCNEQYSATEGADALVLVTEWKRFRSPDFQKIKENMRSSLIVDGRNQYDPSMLVELGFAYTAIGRRG